MKRGTTAASQQDQHLNSVRPDDGTTLGDWNIFKQIFAEHWEAFQYAHPRYRTSY